MLLKFGRIWLGILKSLKIDVWIIWGDKIVRMCEIVTFYFSFEGVELLKVYRLK